MKPSTLLLTLLTGYIIASSGMQAMAERTKMKRNITFIVRKPDKVKNIAVRFHVDPKALAKLNSPLRKRQMVYAGKQLVIPVWLKKKSNLVKESSDFNLADYEPITDSLDAYIDEDFVNMANIEADTVRRITIDKELRSIDKRLLVLTMRQDSLQRAEFESYADMSKKELKKLKMARDSHSETSPVHAEIDTLVQQKNKLSEEKGKINMRVADYEYLVENASYMAAHPEEAEDNHTITIRDWGDDPAKIAATSGGHKK